MKKLIILTAGCLWAATLLAQPVRVLSDVAVAKGYDPQFNADATVLRYLAADDESYPQSAPATDTYVTTENLRLVLYRNGVRTPLYPHGNACNYIWTSLSPDGSRILFNTKFGTAVCDLQGNELINFGRLNAPVWYGNDYVVGMYDTDDGHNYTGSAIAICSVDGTMSQTLTDAKGFGMYPTVSAATGQIAYTTLAGDIRLMQTNLTDQPLRRTLPRVERATPMKKQRKTLSDANADFKDFKIYINPGHGGHDSDDRNITVYPFKQGDPKGFWESNSNLDKGLKLREMLEKLGFQTMMSRTTNTTADDRSLSAIVREANEYDADFMLSIHSNAGGPSNYVLMLYAGIDLNDTQQTYPTPTPCSDESRDISTIIGNNLLENQITTWTSSAPRIAGDKTFARTAMGWSDGYGVLRGLKVPGVISEGRMHDYIPEAYRMMNMDYKWEESWYFMRAFCTCFMDYNLPTGVVGGQVRDAYNKITFPVFKSIRNSRDEYLPIHKAKVSLLKDGEVLQTYTTDTLYNGVYFFWDVQPGQYTVRTEADHYYTLEQTVEVKANEVTYQDMRVNMKRETRPEVVSYSPHVELTDSQEVSVPIVLNFNWDMLSEPTLEAFSISPACEGTLAFENSQRTLRFTPATAFEKATEYTVTLAKTACHPDDKFDNTLAEDFVFKFRTKNRNKLSIIQSYPVADAEDVSLTPTVMLVFDRKLDTYVSASEFYIADKEGQNVFTPAARNFETNTVTSPYGSARFDVNKALAPNTAYQLIIAGTVKDTSDVLINGGDASITQLTIPFTTGQAEQPEDVMDTLNIVDSVFFKVNVEKSVGIADRSIFKDPAKFTMGKSSNNITYTFAGETDDEALFLSPLDLTYVFTDADTLVIDVYGDLSYNTLCAEFSTEGDIHLIPLTTLDYGGWKRLKTSLKELPEKVDFQFTGLKIMRSDNILSEQGTIYLDAIGRIHAVNTALENTEDAAVCVAPNPVEDLLTVLGVDNASLQLLTADGKLVAQTTGNSMDCSALPAGTYLLRIVQGDKALYRSVLKR